MSGGDLSIIIICREYNYVLPTNNLKMDLSYVNVNVGELSIEVEIAQDIRSSAFTYILNALIIVEDLRLEAWN